MLRYRLRTLLVVLALGPPLLAGLWCGIPVVWILVAAVTSSLIAASVGTLLFFWRFDLRSILGATTGSVVGVYFFLIAQCLIDSQLLLVFSAWPASGWDVLGLAAAVCVTGMIGLVLGFLFAGVIRTVDYFSGS